MTPGCSDPLRVKGFHLPPRHGGGGIHLFQRAPNFKAGVCSGAEGKKLRRIFTRVLKRRCTARVKDRRAVPIPSWLPLTDNITRFILNGAYFIQ